MAEPDGSWQFEPGSRDPVDYDRTALGYLVENFHEPIELTIDALRTERFAFPSMQALHNANIDVELLYRQCLPAAGVAVRLGLPVPDVARFLVLFATCQTLILNNVDRHLDLSASYTLRDPAELLRDVHATACYAVAQLYKGMTAAEPPAARALRAMAGVSGDIIQSMYDNYADRFRDEHLAAPHVLLAAYRDPVRSRHLGSGFYSSSLLGLSAYFELDLSPELPGILRDMRRLRQRVDELADLFEDVATGLLSYPVVRLLARPEYHEIAARTVSEMWHRARRLTSSMGRDVRGVTDVLGRDQALHEAHSRLLELLLASGTLRTCHQEAAALWTDVRTAIAHELSPPVAAVLRIVVDLKRAFLERLSMARWNDIPPPHGFSDIRATIIGDG